MISGRLFSRCHRAGARGRLWRSGSGRSSSLGCRFLAEAGAPVIRGVVSGAASTEESASASSTASVTASATASSTASATALTSNTFSRLGYRFVGWSTDPDGKRRLIANGASYPFTTNRTTLYAIWGCKPFAVKLISAKGFGTKIATLEYSSDSEMPMTRYVARAMAYGEQQGFQIYYTNAKSGFLTFRLSYANVHYEIQLVGTNSLGCESSTQKGVDWTQ